VAGRVDRFPGSAGLHLADGVALLHPEEQVFEAMLDGSTPNSSALLSCGSWYSNSGAELLPWSCSKFSASDCSYSASTLSINARRSLACPHKSPT
jgi:hypothetical protein